MTPPDITQAVIADEHPAITAWAARHRWTANVDPATATGTASAAHPVTQQIVVFRADFAGYPAQAPAWWCGDSPLDKTGYPAPMTTAVPGLQGSIFHTNPVICAPWNRLAYTAHGGPHGDWGTPTDWKMAALGSTQAHCIADMLGALRLHMQYSPGMQG